MIIPAPEGLSLRQYQQDGALHLMGNQWALLADEPGVGKTAQVIAAINCAYPGVKVFIGCPETLMLNWLRELRTWLVTDRSIGLASSRKVPNTDIVIANYDIFAKIQSALSGRRWNIAVLDEAHKIKSAEAKCTQAAWTINAYHRWALTGTPILNKPVEAWAVLAWMMRDRVMPYDQYTTAFCNAHLREQWSKKFNQKTKKMEAYKKKVWDVSGAANLDQLHRLLLAEGHMLRRRKVDVLTELPDKIHQVIELSSTKVHSLLAQEHMGAQALGGYEAAISKLKDGDPVGLEELPRYATSWHWPRSNPPSSSSGTRLRKSRRCLWSATTATCSWPWLPVCHLTAPSSWVACLPVRKTHRCSASRTTHHAGYSSAMMRRVRALP